MKIRDKLLLGFGLYTLLAIASGLFAYRDLRTIMTKLSRVEVADDISNNILEVRRYEKNYLLFRDEASLEAFRKYLGAFKNNINNIRAEIVREIGTNNYAEMKKGIEDYENLFFNVVAENLRLEREVSMELRTKGRLIEQRLTGTSLRTFLVLRRYEKNLMLYKDDAALERFRQLSSSVAGQEDVDSYIIMAVKLFELYREEGRSIENLRLKAREIQSFVENISRKERAEIGSILKSSVNLVLFALAIFIIVGTLINIKMATGISGPLRRLERVTRKIAEGDFSEAVTVSGKDEIASLARSFNRMTGKLNETMSSLESSIERLHEKQADLVEAEKLASIGKLAAGIAHEINNPLTSVLTFSSLMLEEMPEDDPRHDRLKRIVGETTRARNIVRQVLSFASEAPLQTVKMDLNNPVSEILDSLRAQGLFRDVELSLSLAENLPVVAIDPVQIGQVVLNIVTNAVHAITPPGKITVSTGEENGLLELIVTDTGAGIAPQNLQKIFDPFFTTKDKTKGTGLGLAVSYGIIKKHGGDIEVVSEVGKGTSFIVRLPANG
jgi:signal transduction histidine kinase